MLKECILLSLVEPVNFIDEKDGSLSVKFKLIFCFFDNSPDLFNTR